MQTAVGGTEPPSYEGGDFVRIILGWNGHNRGGAPAGKHGLQEGPAHRSKQGLSSAHPSDRGQADSGGVGRPREGLIKPIVHFAERPPRPAPCANLRRHPIRPPTLIPYLSLTGHSRNCTAAS